jgi:hypothetical protein
MRARSLVWLSITTVTALFVVLVLSDAIPLVRGPDEWRWTLRVLRAPLWRILIPIVFLTLYVIGVSRWLALFPAEATARPARRIERSGLLLLTIAASLIQIALAAAVWRAPLFEFFADTVSPSVTGFYSVAVTTPDLPAQLPRYAEFMELLPIHPQTHPPGLVLLHWLSWRALEAAPALADNLAMPLRALQCHNPAIMSLSNPQLASAVVGMLIPALGGLAVWPLYALGRRIIGSRQAALAAAAFPLIPMFAMWPGQADQIFPLFVLSGLYFVHTGLENRSAWRFLLAGVILSCATFLSIGNMVMIVIAVLYAGVWWITREAVRRLVTRPVAAQWLTQAAALVIGCLSIWLIYVLVYQVRPLDLLAVGDRLLHESTRCPICPSTNRSYNVWAIWNIVDFAIYLSWPIFVLLLVRLPALLRAAYQALRRRRDSAVAPLTVATLATFGVLVAAGIVRGEVSRIWAYFGPLFMLLALAPVNDQWPRRARGVAVFVGLIALQLVVMNTRWQPYPSYLDEPPEREVNYTAPRPQIETGFDFAHQIKFVGYDLAPSSTTIDLHLQWQALAQPLHAYTVFVHVNDAQGNLIAQQDNMPVHDQLPTSCWQPGEVVIDPYSIVVPDTAPQPLSLVVGLYRTDNGNRLPRDDGQGDSVIITMPPQP